MRRVLRDYSLSLVLTALFLLCWGVQTWVGWVEFVSEQQAHAQAAAVFGADGYIWTWAEATFENWQSEFLQLAAFVVLSAYLLHKGSPQSKEGSERQERKLDDLTRKLDWLLHEAEAQAQQAREREARREARRERERGAR
jgi:hypothetical protein